MEGLCGRLDQHFLDQFVYSGLPHVKLSDSLLAPLLSKAKRFRRAEVVRGGEAGRESFQNLLDFSAELQPCWCWSRCFFAPEEVPTSENFT